MLSSLEPSSSYSASCESILSSPASCHSGSSSGACATGSCVVTGCGPDADSVGRERILPVCEREEGRLPKGSWDFDFRIRPSRTPPCFCFCPCRRDVLAFGRGCDIEIVVVRICLI